jgi:5-methylthioadenosine/S-adenosylhomocysteine deaminase
MPGRPRPGRWSRAVATPDETASCRGGLTFLGLQGYKIRVVVVRAQQLRLGEHGLQVADHVALVEHFVLQEMRMVLRAHRVPGMEDDVPTSPQVFRMATAGGAKTTAFGDTIGALEVGRGADLVLLDWRQISYPYLDTEMKLLDAVIQRAKTSGVATVMCDGEVIYADGKFTKVDRDGALKALHDDLQRALSNDEVERRQVSKALLPHVKAFYAGYFDQARHQPFYKPSSRV